jgi:hypothetical protein
MNNNASLPLSTVSNDQFLNAIFGEQYVNSHVTSFVCDPNNIPPSESARCWAGGAYKNTKLKSGSKQFYTVSLFLPDETGRSRRRKSNFSACYVIGLDDVREKLPIEQVDRLPPPSIVLKSSMHSEQWLYLLETPCTDISRIDNLHDGLISNGLAPNSKDPGQKGVTRYLRLPEGVNTKAKRIAENNGTPPRSVITSWHPERRYSLEQLGDPFGVDIDAPRTDSRIDGATNVSDHPLLQTPAVNIKKVLSAGRFDITCPWVDEHTDCDDSGSAIFTNYDGSIGFKCHHGTCDSRTGKDLILYIGEHDVGFDARLKSWQLFRGLPDINTPLMAGQSAQSALGALRSSCANGESQKMRSQMNDDKFVLKDIAIAGQWTVLFAAPNTGKTLLTLWMVIESITNGSIHGEDVFYANCDDTYRGGVEKLEVAESHGFNMLLPSVNKFKAGELLSTMMEMVEQQEASGKVIILDTLKKFTDLMDKKLSSKFGEISRAFVSAGGSVICLAHVNKHKGADGKSINAGTSDIRDDADCCYTIELLSKDEGFCTTTYTIEFECTKSRGDVAGAVAFQYTKEKGSGYLKLLDSVARLTKDAVDMAQQSALRNEQKELDTEIIENIRCAITNGHCSNGELVAFVVETYKTSRSKVRAVLERYEGNLWLVEKGINNKSTYHLNTAPGLPVSFF